MPTRSNRLPRRVMLASSDETISTIGRLAMSDEEDEVGRVKDRLVAAKERTAREGRHLTGAARPAHERLPPGQNRVEKWPVLDLGVHPHVAPADWRLAIDGLVANPVSWDWAQFRAQPQVTTRSDIHCVTTWSHFDNVWEGVAARHVLGVVRPRPEARFLMFHSLDGYTTNLPLPYFDDDEALLAHSWHGAPLTREHGGPVRAVVPKLYFWKSAKWLSRIEFLAEDRPGFWEQHGYHDRGDPWAEERYG
jgi:DMSO/TMAO reductase YedYZ molybdopterin-dependent catalytic subunit